MRCCPSFVFEMILPGARVVSTTAMILSRISSDL